jgi:hypothetical protein
MTAVHDSPLKIFALKRSPVDDRGRPRKIGPSPNAPHWQSARLHPVARSAEEVMACFMKSRKCSERIRSQFESAGCMAAQKGRAQVAQRVEVGPGGSWRPGVRVIAKQFAVDPGTVQRISRPSPQASPSDNHRVRNEGGEAERLVFHTSGCPLPTPPSTVKNLRRFIRLPRRRSFA